MDSVDNYTTQNLHGDLKENGVQKVMLQATIREERLFQLHMEVLDPDYVKANKADVAKAINDFIVKALDKAAVNGLPIAGKK